LRTISLSSFLSESLASPHSTEESPHV